MMARKRGRRGMDRPVSKPKKLLPAFPPLEWEDEQEPNLDNTVALTPGDKK